MLRWISAGVMFLLPIVGSLAEDKVGEKVFDVPALIATPLHAKTLKSSERQDIVTEEVRFHSERDGDKDVSIFAYFSYPKGARKLPAYIWNPGGLSQASPYWTQPGASRGYAVLCIDFPQPGYRSTGGYPINSGLELGDNPRKAPIYHGAVALLKAVSYLESRAEVDKDRIGMGGSSWGGFFTTLMVGIDPRLKVGACLYGSGSLQLGNAWWDGQSRHGRIPTPEERERWRKTLDPAWRLQTAKKTPIAWITGTNDGFYSMPSVMQSYEMAAGPKHLTLLPNWDHALPSELQEEQVFLWLDVYLKGDRSFPKLTPVTVRKDGERLVARWDFQGDATAADLIASYGEAGNWQGRYWHTLKAEIEGHTCRAELPGRTLPCYVSGAVTDKNGLRYSTPLLRVDPVVLGVKASAALPDYNGCVEWGGFEDGHIAFLERHHRSGQARWIPRRSTDAKEGKYSAVLNSGRTVLPPILSTATVPHRFTCCLKAEKPVEVTVQLAGEHKQFRAGTDWTEAHVDLTPTNTLMGGFPASLTIPAGATVLIDAVSFRPIVPTKKASEKAKRAALPAPDPRFETAVLAILKANCVRCHAQEPRKGGLDLSSRQGISQGSESGPVMVAGKPAESLLLKMVREGRMPPDKKNQLSGAEVETIRRWIEAGAPSLATGKDTGRTAVSSVTQHDIIPMLLLHCTACHGGRLREAGLDLRTKTAMLKGGKSGPALVPGRPDESLMLKKVQAGEMPPFLRIMKANVKPLSASQIERLTQWIALGAPEAPTEVDVANINSDPSVTDEDRSFWSFRPPSPDRVPAAKDARHIANPVDAFIQNKLEESGLTWAPEADRLTLVRRAYLDVTGLLPEPDEIQAFLADRNPGAYERLIDRLLASPHYGERWGRYWLDLAGYADSEGHFADSVRPFAYRYRDYVIRSFNADKPYDRFLLEQIAGDELADYERAPAITQEIMDNLVATGFLRMAPDGTNPTELNSVPERLDVIADEMEVFSSAVLGLTLQCARCHDHKYDPIPQRDYYRLAAVFKGAFDEYDWLRPYERVLPHLTPDETRKLHAHNAPLSAQLAVLRQALDALAQPLREKHQEAALAKLPEVLRADLRRMLAAPPEKRDAVQKYLAEKFEKALRFDMAQLAELNAEFKKAAEENARQMEPLQNRLLTGATILALWDRGDPSPAYVYRQGDAQKPGQLVGPGVPSVLTDGRAPFVVKPPWPDAKKTGRRLALAQWLVRPDHPLTARVMVNRIWKHHFGRGLVSTLQNFGHTGARPTHPELLDWLAVEFVRQGWSVKAMHRLLLTSAVYRQSSARRPDLEKADPENRLLGRMPIKRMEAEVLYDALLQVGDRLDPRPFDPPDPVDVRPDGLVTPLGTQQGWRRSIYVLQRRKELPTLLESFDFPQMTPNCIQRVDTTVASQALHLMNDSLVQALAGAFARRVAQEAGTDPARRIERTYWIALSRPPSAEESALGLRALAELAQAWTKHHRPAEEPADRALATFCHTLVNSAAFLTVD